MIKGKQKENSDSVFTLDDLIQESMEMNNFLTKRINTSPISKTQSFSKFFSRKIRLQNSLKKNFWERNFCQSNVSSLYIT